ncbi:unnamed protein product [Echinostoma caproni]|uniref:Uncharacterized protein n=1 Tax=Echinostoma caproni TaxID=27848 RepID=A0A3P8LEX1_9TREM|nr:unnamed protein product [Echinostoma caproni]
MLRHGRRILDCIVIVCGSCPDQAGPHIINYTEQILAGYRTPRLHLVDYDSRNPTVSQFLAQLANTRDTNSFHCFAAGSDEAIYTSDDIARLLREITDAQYNVINYTGIHHNLVHMDGKSHLSMNVR